MKGLLALLAAVGGPLGVYYLYTSHQQARRGEREAKWEITPGKAGEGKQAIFLTRGKGVHREQVQIGDAFEANDEFAFDEHMLDARRQQKVLNS